MSSRPSPWTIMEVLHWTSAYFQEKGVSESRPSAEVLLAHALGLSRLDLYLRHDQPLSPEELARFKALVKRRAAGEPVAYLTGHKEFWSLDFLVTPEVLIPRPETEILVEAVLEVFGGGDRGSETPAPFPHRTWALEVGVGSGAVVVALANELSCMQWVALDVSMAALRVARTNARRHEVNARIHFLSGDLLSAIKPPPSFTLMVANLPYIPTAAWEALPRDVKEFEPKEALVAGEDGLALIKPLAREAHRVLVPGGWLALEVGPGQAEFIQRILQDTEAYDRLDMVRDYLGINRVVRARRSRTP